MKHTYPSKCITGLVTQELERANGLYPQFTSSMEALGVIEEEVSEAWEDLDAFKENYATFKHWLRSGDSTITTTAAENMRRNIEYAITELIQVGAMCQKYVNYAKDGIKHEKKTPYIYPMKFCSIDP